MGRRPVGQFLRTTGTYSYRNEGACSAVLRSDVVMTNSLSLRPNYQKASEVSVVVKTCPDPEVPELTIEDLGILRGVEMDDGKAVITITPNYSGCPAMETISADVTNALAAAGYHDAKVDLVLT